MDEWIDGWSFALWAAGLLNANELRLLRGTVAWPSEESVAILYAESREPQRWAAVAPDATGLLAHARAAAVTHRDALLRCRERAPVWYAEPGELGRPRVPRTSSPWLVGMGARPTPGPSLAVVGTRQLRASDEARFTRLLSEWISGERLEVWSGGAIGCDALAHRCAIAVGQPSFAVLGAGVAQAGPRTNDRLFEQLVERGGGLISDMPPNQHAWRNTFIDRNSLLASCCDAVLVLRAPFRSGAVVTARTGLNLGMPVLVVPGEPDDETALGSNLLAQQGARLCVRRSDIDEVLRESANGTIGELLSAPRVPVPDGGRDGGSASAGAAGAARAAARRAAAASSRRSGGRPTGPPTGLAVSAPGTGEQSSCEVCTALGAGTLHRDELAARAGLTAAELSVRLLELELAGLVVALEGGHYGLTPG